MAIVATILAGRAAELELLGDRSELSGGSSDSDLARATKSVVRMELDLGLGAGLAVADATSSKELAKRLDRDLDLRARVERILGACLERARTIVRHRSAEVEAVAARLERDGVWRPDGPAPVATPRTPVSSDAVVTPPSEGKIAGPQRDCFSHH